MESLNSTIVTGASAGPLAGAFAGISTARRVGSTSIRTLAVLRRRPTSAWRISSAFCAAPPDRSRHGVGFAHAAELGSVTLEGGLLLFFGYDDFLFDFDLEVFIDAHAPPSRGLLHEPFVY